MIIFICGSFEKVTFLDLKVMMKLSELNTFKPKKNVIFQFIENTVVNRARRVPASK